MDNNGNPNLGGQQPVPNQPMPQPVQGQPMVGAQPMQGQPMPGQPMPSQPVQGQPMQGQPVQGQQPAGPQIGVVPFLTPIGVEQPPVPGTVPGTMPIAPTSAQQTPNNPGAVTSSENERTAMEKPKKDIKGIVMIVVIVVTSLIGMTFIGLFIWKNLQYEEISVDVNAKVEKAVAIAKDEVTTKMEDEFLVREKYPYRTFSGPADYGQLTFEYPKTWSVYVAADALNGGDYFAYFNPIEVNPVSENTINALRLIIRDKDIESVVAEYKKAMDKKDSNLTMESVTFSGITANRYTGTIPGTDLSGYIVIFKIRDKTVIMQTDTVVFEEDFNRLLETIKFNA